MRRHTRTRFDRRMVEHTRPAQTHRSGIACDQDQLGPLRRAAMYMSADGSFCVELAMGPVA